MQGRIHPSSALFYPPSSHVLDSCFQCKKQPPRAAGQPAGQPAQRPSEPASQPTSRCRFRHEALHFPTSLARLPMVFVDSSGSYLRAMHACMHEGARPPVCLCMAERRLPHGHPTAT